MATKRGKRSTKKVKSLKSKSLSGGKAKGVRGGALKQAYRWDKLTIQGTHIIK